MEYAERGDAARTMALPWDGAPVPRRGPRQRLDLPRIADAAIAEADRAGPVALSMRALADVLGIGAASLYTYVPGKAELLERMVDRRGRRPTAPRRGDRVASRAARPRHVRPRHLPRASLAAAGGNVADGVRHERHHPLRRSAGPPRGTRSGGCRRRALRCSGRVVHAGGAAAVVEAEQAPVRTGSSDDEWWERRAPLLDERINDRFPRLVALGEAGAFAVSDPALPYTLQRALDRFAFGLDLVLDSIGDRIAAARN